jgi:hypothetical protein
MATLDADDLDAVAEKVIEKLRAIVAAAVPPGPGDRPTLDQCLLGAGYEAYGDIDVDRSIGEAVVTLPESGLPAVAFDIDDTDVAKFRHRKA